MGLVSQRWVRYPKRRPTDTFVYYDMKTMLTLFGWFLVFATAAPLIRTGEWWIRAFDFPRVQIACVSLVTLVLLCVYADGQFVTTSLLLLLSVCVLYQTYRIYPYTALSPFQVLPAKKTDPACRLSLLVVNIQMENREVDRFLEVVKEANPDILFILEPNAWWANQLSALDQTYPYATKQPQENFYGMIVYSRLKLITSEVNFLVENDIPSIYSIVELRSGDLIDLYCLHPRPPVPYVDTEERDAELLIVGRKIRQSAKPTVVGGDLNDVAGSHTNKLFQKISRLLDPRVGRGLYNTHPTHMPLLRSPVDHVFHSDEFRLVTLKRLPNVGSDHFPIFIELSYEPKKQAAQEEPQATQADKEEADEMIEEVK